MKSIQIISLLLLSSIALSQFVGGFKEKKFDPNDKFDALALSKVV